MNWITTNLVKILAGLCVILVLACSVEYVIILKKDAKIVQLQSTVDDLVTDNRVLEQQVETCKKIQLAERESRNYQEENIDRILAGETTSLEKLDKVITEVYNEQKSNQGVSRSSPLPSDLSRVLNEHCQTVRGQACNAP